MVHKNLKYRRSQHAILKQKREETLKSQRKTGRRKPSKRLKPEGKENLPRQKFLYPNRAEIRQGMSRISMFYKALKDNIAKFIPF